MRYPETVTKRVPVLPGLVPETETEMEVPGSA